MDKKCCVFYVVKILELGILFLLDSINKASKKRGDELEAKHGSVVHKSCRLGFTNAKSIEFCQKMNEEAATKQRRPSATFRQYI